MKYKPQPRFTHGFLLRGRMESRRSLIGYLFPQPVVAGIRGERILLDALLGSGFALLCHAAEIHWLRRLASCAVWGRLRPRLVAVALPGGLPEPSDHVSIIVDGSRELTHVLA